jgi:hypothetical protein
MKTAFVNGSRVSGFRKWSLAHPAVKHDNEAAGGGQPVAIGTEPTEEPHRPRLSQGVVNAL